MGDNRIVLKDGIITGDITMTRKSLVAMVLLAVAGFVLPVNADTFKNKQTGETFNGFRTQKSSANQTLVYNDTTKKLDAMDLRDYEVTLDGKGRRNSVVMISITDEDVLLSETVSKIVSEAIVKASNTGPQFILIKIDNPGGRGDYMKELCSTIAKTDNCKVVAYISGGSFGGAYSAAAILALACDKIYIASTASISSIGPFADTSGLDFMKLYSPDNLTSYGIFAATLAEQNQRPALLARALLDKKISIVEVTDTDGKTSWVEKNLRQPTQTIVKTLCEGFSDSLEKSAASTDQKDSSPAIPADIHSRVLNLTAAEAVRLKLADRIVDSVQEVLADMKASDAQIANAPGIDTAVKQFTAARKNIGKRLAKIEFLENRTATLEDQFNTMEKEIRTTPATQERKIGFRRGRINSYSQDRSYNGVYNVDSPAGSTSVYSSGYGSGYSSSGKEIELSKTTTTKEPSLAANQIKTELSYVLTDLISEYRQTINTAKRWVGSLPPEIQLQSLEKNMNSAMALSENLRFRP
jgi:membrane-bound ClpP family serine protease